MAVKRKNEQSGRKVFGFLLFASFLVSGLDAAVVPKETITIEAENAVLVSPMEILYDSKASNDLFIYTSSSSIGKADFFFNINSTQPYALWTRILAPNAASDSFTVSIDTQADDVFELAASPYSLDWRWVRVTGRLGVVSPATSVPRLFNLAPGLHSLHIKSREPDTKLDKIIITTDLNLSATTLNAQVIFHSCPQVIPQASQKCIEKLVQYKLKPALEAESTNLGDCKILNEFMVRDLDPITALDRAEDFKNYWTRCSSCTVIEVTHGCPWEIMGSTPIP